MERVDSDKLKHYLRDDAYAQGVDDLLAGSDEGGMSGVISGGCRLFMPANSCCWCLCIMRTTAYIHAPSHHDNAHKQAGI